jgi:hypothetical protein
MAYLGVGRVGVRFGERLVFCLRSAESDIRPRTGGFHVALCGRPGKAVDSGSVDPISLRNYPQSGLLPRFRTLGRLPAKLCGTVPVHESAFAVPSCRHRLV